MNWDCLFTKNIRNKPDFQTFGNFLFGHNFFFFKEKVNSNIMEIIIELSRVHVLHYWVPRPISIHPNYQPCI